MRRSDRLRTALVLSLFFLPAPAGAIERRSDLTLFINPGVALGPSTRSTFTLTDGTFLETTQTLDEVSRLIEWEVNYSFFTFFGLSAIVEGTKYRNAADPLANQDSEMAFMAVPRIQTGENGVTFWAGVGLGWLISKLGQPNRAGAALDYRLEESSSNYAWSPRGGLDFVLEGYTFGIQVAFLKSSGTRAGTAVDRGTLIEAPMSQAFDRSWWSVTAKFGFQL
ncbi:MAG TPA: hypothetical protein VM598_13190 [Bdellovibrionota bacterium]|nr:hypothetical protein [Bdellovibrionota bacterium]